MLSVYARNWWAIALRGAVAIILGILALVWPGLTLLTLVILFGTYAVVDGVFELVYAIARRKQNEFWWAIALAGLAGIAFGVITIVWPSMTALLLLSLIAAWAIITGILEIVAAIQLRHVISNEWLMAIGGLLSVLLGVLVLLFPGAGALSVVWMIALYAITSGILRSALAFELRGCIKRAEELVNEAA